MKFLIALVLLACTIFSFMLLRPTGKKLYTPETRLGILNLEFAYDTDHTSKILHAWQADEKIKIAKENTYLDFVFLVFYSIFLFYTCKYLSKKITGNMRNFGLLLSKGSLIAGGLDIIENSGMLLTLSGNQSGFIPLATAICATIKWLIALLAILYVLFVSPYALYVSLKNKSSVP